MAYSSDYVRLEKRLVLLGWLNSLFGFATNREMLQEMRPAGEGFDPLGRSYVYYRLVSRGDKLAISLSTLTGYDDNIRTHLAAINRYRAEPITLRYFQYLALLYAEVFLDWRFNRPDELLNKLNEFVAAQNARRESWEPQYKPFAAGDLNKLAFWMATGSGKTLLMHINLHQFLHYNRQPLDNILLITPKENLTEQHMDDMAASNIPCQRFNLAESGLSLAEPNTVRVIEITKLVEEKRGGGVSVPVEAFEGNNLIFVDEGHKGSGGQAWRTFREALGQTGFTFEYSATFGQALTATRNDDLTVEYGKAIGFDYSYHYFHADGHGKDFRVLNLPQETTEEQTEMLLLGNLLSFYQQQRCFQDHEQALRPYNLEKPLWVFVGSTVNAVYSEGGRKRSDVLTVVRFLHHFLENHNGWAFDAIQRIVEGRTGLKDASDKDVFAGAFEYLHQADWDARARYRDVLTSIFHVPTGGALHLCDIRGKADELGLKATGASDYFGLIYIGDTSTFKGLVVDDNAGIVMEEDAMGKSLFEGINKPDTPINVLIGAKKFMEGWNSYRVSNMGLLNIGRSEGSEIIQLFGRGVRLYGLDRLLKRSSAMDGSHPDHIGLLETLNIFAVRANYMAQFRDYLEREGVEPDGYVELPLPIKPEQAFLNQGLVVPRVPKGRSFVAEQQVVLRPDDAAKVNIDLSLKVQSLRSTADGVAAERLSAGQEHAIPHDSLGLIDWSVVYLDLLELKQTHGFWNLIIPPDAPRKLLEHTPRLYRLVADESLVKPTTFAAVARLQDAVIAIVRRYTEKYYRVCQERWDTANMVYTQVTADDPNFRDYTVRVPKSDVQLILNIEALIAQAQRIYEEETQILPNVHFDRHLYQPLLVVRNDGIRSEPPRLEPSEEQFVRDIREYVGNSRSALAGRDVFLLRNLTRGKGVGFFESAGFYPDFILWIKQQSGQRIVFIEPHGMFWAKAYSDDDKARLHEHLADLAQTWAQVSGMADVSLDSYIISGTSYDNLSERYGDGSWTLERFEDHHILFRDESGAGKHCRHFFK